MELASTSTQTPIEIALGIDKDGYTTARALYEFLSGEKVTFRDGPKRTSSRTNILMKM